MQTGHPQTTGWPNRQPWVDYKAFTKFDRHRCSVDRNPLCHTSLFVWRDITQNLPPITSTMGEKYGVQGGSHTPTPKYLHIHCRCIFQLCGIDEMNISAPQACVTPIQLREIQGVTKRDSGCRTNTNTDGPTKKRKLRLTNVWIRS